MPLTVHRSVVSRSSLLLQCLLERFASVLDVLSEPLAGDRLSKGSMNSRKTIVARSAGCAAVGLCCFLGLSPNRCTINRNGCGHLIELDTNNMSYGLRRLSDL